MWGFDYSVLQTKFHRQKSKLNLKEFLKLLIRTLGHQPCKFHGQSEVSLFRDLVSRVFFIRDFMAETAWAKADWVGLPLPIAKRLWPLLLRLNNSIQAIKSGKPRGLSSFKGFQVEFEGCWNPCKMISYEKAHFTHDVDL